MSEYQFIAFRAIDGPVSEKNLGFMRKQSTQAEITPRSFENEYHYGDFHGNAPEMLRRGYDLFLHYANYGIRTLMIRLPAGLPDLRAAEPYIGEDALRFMTDKQGSGGAIVADPYYEAGYLEEIWDVQGFPDRLVPLRQEILDGDLRPLYLMHLGLASDCNHDPEESIEAPAPAGLDKPTPAQCALAEFYGLSEYMLKAAARNSPSLPARDDAANPYSAWLERRPDFDKNIWLSRLLAEPDSSVRREILAEFRKDTGASAWPIAHLGRTVAELKTTAEELQRTAKDKAAQAAARKRVKMLADMAADPEPTLRESENLVARRTGEAYQQAAGLLADLREALAGSKHSKLPEEQALKLKAKNPTLHRLTSELKKKGLLKAAP